MKAQRNLCGEGYQYGQVLAQYGTLEVPGSEVEGPYFLTIAQGSPRSAAIRYRDRRRPRAGAWCSRDDLVCRNDLPGR